MWKGFAESEVKRFLKLNVRLLENAGADFIAIPCNSVHYFLPVMRRAVHIPILSMVEETADAISTEGLSKVLLLATEFTVNRGIYDKPLANRGITLVKPAPTEKRLVEEIIIRVESGRRSKSDRAKVTSVVNKLRKDFGVEGVIAGCTEIPLLIQAEDLPIPLFDTIDILASSAYALIMGRQSFREFYPSKG
jgi:aspartate racemase